MYGVLLAAALVAALPGLVLAEPFTAWESSGDIWARDEATGRTWNLTADWPWAASTPDVAAYTAVWQTSNNVFPAIYGYDFDNRFPVEMFPVYISVDRGTPTEPRIGIVATAGWGDYWCAWRMAGDIWAIRIKPPLLYDNAFVALPGYAGWFDVEADQLLYDGGSVTLDDPPPPPPAPEPSALVLLATGTVGLLLLVWRRRPIA